MPLSDHEQRLLDQIERALYAEDPKFASTVRHTDLRTHTRRRIQRASLLFVAGFGLLLTGVFRGGSAAVGFGAGGFVVMLLALFYGLTAVRRTSGRPDTGRRGGGTKAPRTSVLTRVEQRWKRRWDERGHS